MRDRLTAVFTAERIQRGGTAFESSRRLFYALIFTLLTGRQKDGWIGSELAKTLEDPASTQVFRSVRNASMLSVKRPEDAEGQEGRYRPSNLSTAAPISASRISDSPTRMAFTPAA